MRCVPAIHCSFERRFLRLMRPKKTILCVDDNEQALSVRKFMLETRGYRVLTAASSQQALELFREGGIDLVLSDLIMPYMDGNELVRRMKELAPEVPAILISGSVKAFDRANRADAFLPKGACSPVELLERVRMMVARKRGPKKGHGRLIAGACHRACCGARGRDQRSIGGRRLSGTATRGPHRPVALGSSTCQLQSKTCSPSLRQRTSARFIERGR